MYLRGLFKVCFYSAFCLFGFFFLFVCLGFSGRIINLAADFCKIVVYWIPNHLDWRGPCSKVLVLEEEIMVCSQCLEWLPAKCNQKKKRSEEYVQFMCMYT